MSRTAWALGRVAMPPVLAAAPVRVGAPQVRPARGEQRAKPTLPLGAAAADPLPPGEAQAPAARFRPAPVAPPPGAGAQAEGPPTRGMDTGAAPGTAFASVLSIFKTRCVPCHSAGAFAVPKTSLYLTADVAYSSLVGVAADETCAGILVVPGSPSQSYLVQKLTEQTPCSGVQMPMAYEAPFMGLTSAQMATIQSWIDAGAPP